MNEGGNTIFDDMTIRTPKDVAIIRICGGAVTLRINDMCAFTPPTEEQRKNLKEMLCIDVEILEDTDA